VLSSNVFRPEQGGVLDVDFKPSQDGQVVIACYNMAGELVRPLASMGVTAGRWYQAKWDGRNDQTEMVAAGVYFISLKGAGLKIIRKVVLLK
jgi:hypothetical protein